MASWAAAAQRRHGAASVLTVEGTLSPQAALTAAATPRAPAAGGPSSGSWRRRIPEPLTTLAKDLRRIEENRRFTHQIDVDRWRELEVPYVLSLHGLFWDAGLRLARGLAVPSVLVVDATQVEEARSWGIRRWGHGALAERFGERPQLSIADVVVCVSDEVAAQVERLAGNRELLVVPNGVDPQRFHPGPGDAGLRADLGLEGAFVIGWTGSFRTFHGLEVLIDAVARLRSDVPEAVLLLVGDGQGLDAIRELARTRGVRAVFTGTVSFDAMPEHLRLMDVAVALAPGARFHYSPVKLREYQAAGVPVVAAAAGEMARDLGETATLVTPGDAAALADAVRALYRDPARRAGLGAMGRTAVLESGTWDHRLAQVERELGIG
jgi:glycosyltransferase involved in cell wall biosynthesis